MRIAVIGLGKLGAPLAAVLAGAGHDVIGVDVRAEVVAAFNQGIAPVDEPGLPALLKRHRSRIRATTDAAAAAAASEMIFIIVPTPTADDGTFSSAFVLRAIEDIGAGLRSTDAYQVVVVTSTLTPGAMDAEVRPALERATNGRPGLPPGLCYNPEFIALGSTIRDMRRPDFVLIGESDARAGQLLASVHRSVVGDSVPIQRMNFVNAELAKLAVNGYVTVKISYANMLAELCERTPGGDVAIVTAAVGHDRRIGHRYFAGTVGYGGPCFPRDNLALGAFAAHCGGRADLALAADAINRRQVERLKRLVEQFVTPDRRVAILGLAYKPDTPVADASQGVILANLLAEAGLTVTAYDPQAMPAAAPQLDASIACAESIDSCLAAADLLVIVTPWREFADLPARLAQRTGERKTVIDCWRMLDRAHARGVADLVYVGRALASGQHEDWWNVRRTACTEPIETHASS
jgi:UDPglucose 6-dehydrogenase